MIGNVEVPLMLRPLRARSALITMVLACFVAISTAHAQETAQLARINELKLEVLKVGRVTAYYAPGDRERAEQLATLTEQAAASFEDKLGLSFEFQLAALSPKDWFSLHGDGLPYGIPWASVAERLIVVPASTTEGALIRGRGQPFNRRMIEFVGLHEFGHIANKAYFHSASTHEEFPVPWFEELVATYFAYAFFDSFDPTWTQLARREWTASVNDYTPPVLSLDWRFMRSLPGPELAQTYGWYQLVLNLRAATVYAEYGLAFLTSLKETLPFDTMDSWATETLLTHLEHIAPGFERWSRNLQSGT